MISCGFQGLPYNIIHSSIYDRLTQGETNKGFLRTGRVVFFRATAYRTFVAFSKSVRDSLTYTSWATFIRFVYFDKIAYAKLKSTYIDEEAAVARFSDKTCSPKSMYRFADYVGSLIFHVHVRSDELLVVRYREPPKFCPG